MNKSTGYHGGKINNQEWIKVLVSGFNPGIQLSYINDIIIYIL